MTLVLLSIFFLVVDLTDRSLVKLNNSILRVAAIATYYRFFNSTTGAHFYTPLVAERDNVEDNLPDFQSEGIAYYALPIALKI